MATLGIRGAAIKILKVCTSRFRGRKLLKRLGLGALNLGLSLRLSSLFEYPTYYGTYSYKKPIKRLRYVYRILGSGQTILEQAMDFGDQRLGSKVWVQG